MGKIETIQERNARLVQEHMRRTAGERRRAYWSAKQEQEQEDRRRELRRADDRRAADSRLVADWTRRFDEARLG